MMVVSGYMAVWKPPIRLWRFGNRQYDYGGSESATTVLAVWKPPLRSAAIHIYGPWRFEDHPFLLQTGSLFFPSPTFRQSNFPRSSQHSPPWQIVLGAGRIKHSHHHPRATGNSRSSSHLPIAHHLAWGDRFDNLNNSDRAGG